MAEGHRIGTYDVTGCYWTDIGSPDAYARSVFNELRFSGESIFVHHETQECTNADFHGFVVLERNCRLDRSVSLINCIVLPEGRVESNGHFENAIIGKDYVLTLKDPVRCGLPLSKDKVLIGTGGSDRRYYRVQRDERTAVLMQCDPSDPDYDRHLEFARFFGMNGLPVPELPHLVARGL